MTTSWLQGYRHQPKLNTHHAAWATLVVSALPWYMIHGLVHGISSMRISYGRHARAVDDLTASDLMHNGVTTSCSPRAFIYNLLGTGRYNGGERS